MATIQLPEMEEYFKQQREMWELFCKDMRDAYDKAMKTLADRVVQDFKK